MPKAVLTIGALLGVAAAVADDADQVDYLRDIKPVLEARCYACHGVLKQKSGLRLDTAQSILEGGTSGPVVVRGNSEQSRLIDAVTGDVGIGRMPLDGEPLTPEQIDLMRRWIDQGVRAPAHEKPPADPRSHWAFQPPESTRPSTSSPWSTDDRQTGVNPIDAFLAVTHREMALTPAPPADRRTLLRRIYLDLIGLPPPRPVQDAFLADDSPDGYERVVDRLLASPQYGERWARHWMDVWRYADWSGEVNNQIRGSPRHIWRWRDWIVESLNADRGYDRMVLEMVSGDEVAPTDGDTLRATGFLARNWYKFNRNVWLDNTVEHTAKAFLGLTFGCAKCHDHKYDPISQKDYYALRAFFEPHDVRTDPIPGQPDTETDGLVRVFDADPSAPTYLFHRGDERQPDLDHPVSPALPEVFGARLAIEPVSLPPREGYPDRSTGRRLALATWITSRRNPLTARVAVNHMWLRHFGSPLVNVVTDFGLRSPEPRFAKLLDRLAVEFMRNGWSMKRLHRQMVTSEAYRRASGGFDPEPATLSRDPDNVHLWRMEPRRLEAEAIRDGILQSAGQLNLTMGGQEIPLKQGESSRRRSLYFRHGHERQVPFLELFDGANVLDCYRRTTSIVPQQALALSNSVLVRSQSRWLARRLSAECGEGEATDARFVRVAFEQILCRAPSDAEMRSCRDFLTRQAALVSDRGGLTYSAHGAESPVPTSSDPRTRARQSLVHVLLNHNEFVTVR